MVFEEVTLLQVAADFVLKQLSCVRYVDKDVMSW